MITWVVAVGDTINSIAGTICKSILCPFKPWAQPRAGDRPRAAFLVCFTRPPAPWPTIWSVFVIGPRHARVAVPRWCFLFTDHHLLDSALASPTFLPHGALEEATDKAVALHLHVAVLSNCCNTGALALFLLPVNQEGVRPEHALACTSSEHRRTVWRYQAEISRSLGDGRHRILHVAPVMCLDVNGGPSVLLPGVIVFIFISWGEGAGESWEGSVGWTPWRKMRRQTTWDRDGSPGLWRWRGTGHQYRLLFGVDHLLALHIFGFVCLKSLHSTYWAALASAIYLPAQVVWTLVEEPQRRGRSNWREGLHVDSLSWERHQNCSSQISFWRPSESSSWPCEDFKPSESF